MDKVAEINELMIELRKVKASSREEKKLIQEDLEKLYIEKEKTIARQAISRRELDARINDAHLVYENIARQSDNFIVENLNIFDGAFENEYGISVQEFRNYCANKARIEKLEQILRDPRSKININEQNDIKNELKELHKETDNFGSISYKYDIKSHKRADEYIKHYVRIEQDYTAALYRYDSKAMLNYQKALDRYKNFLIYDNNSSINMVSSYLDNIKSEELTTGKSLKK